jgi:cytidylate kinase
MSGMADTASPPLVTIASQPGAGGEVVAPRVAEALGVPFLDRALPGDPEDPEQRPRGVVGDLARASTMLASAPLERLELDDARVRSELAEFLARARGTGGVVLGRGAMFVLAGAPGALHVLLAGSLEGRIARVAEREAIGRADARRRVEARDRAKRDYVRRTFGVDPDDRTLYDLVIDTIAVGIDAAVEIVLTATRARAPRETT